MKLLCPIHQSAETCPDAIAIRGTTRILSYRELDRLVGRYAKKMATLGVFPKDRIGILALNSVEYVAAVFAIIRLGASFVPINLRWSQSEWEQMFAAAQPKFILADRNYFSVMNFPVPLYPLEIMSERNFHSFTPPKYTGVSVKTDEDKEIAVVFTSGSSGVPKGVILSFANFYYNAVGSNLNLPVEGEDCWLASLPFYHVGGLSILFRCFIAGASVFVQPQKETSDLMILVQREKITHVSLVPTMLERMLRSYPPGRFLKYVLLGGAPVPEALIEKTHRFPFYVLTTYGMTETASQITALSPHDPSDKLHTAGRCLKFAEIRVLAENGEELPGGKTGEIAVRGKVLSRGNLTGIEHRGTDSWFLTGDLGFIDREDYLVLQGRKDDMIISGGENIHPAAVENVVAEFSGVRGCFILGVADEKWGMRPVLFVEVANPAAFNLNELKSYLKNKLSKIAYPERIILLEKLPRRSIGKVDRKALKKYLSQSV